MAMLKRVELSELLVALPTVLADDDEALVLVLLVQFVQVRDGDAAGAASGGPELDEVRFAGNELLDRISLEPLACLKFGGGIANFERRGSGFGSGGEGATDGESGNRSPLE
jgi:hypothetical protein